MIKQILKRTTFCVSILFFSTISLQASNSVSSNTQKNKSLDSTVKDLANKLLKSSRVNPSRYGDIAITSFVDLNQFNHTTHLGRSLSESMVNELFARGFDVSDFRGQNSIAVNANGEYYLTRDINRLKQTMQNNYILVGTFTTADDAVLINARIMDNQSGHIVAAARTYYKSTNCKELGTCPKKRIIKIRGGNRYSTNVVVSQELIANNEYANIALVPSRKKEYQNRYRYTNYNRRTQREITQAACDAFVPNTTHQQKILPKTKCIGNCDDSCDDIYQPRYIRNKRVSNISLIN